MFKNKIFKKYLSNQDGNFAVMFSISLTALLLGVGAAIDISGATSQKADLQSIADMAVLGSNTDKDLSDEEIIANIKAFIEQNNATGLQLDPVVTFENDHIQVHLNADYDTSVMSAFGKDAVPVSVLSETPRTSEVDANIALVLDTTGSMEGDNIIALQNASESLLDTLENTTSDVQVSVVPFSRYVNVGLGNRNAPWMDVPDDSSFLNPAEPCETKQDKKCPPGQEFRQEFTRYNDGVPSTRFRNRCAVDEVNEGAPYQFCPAPVETKIRWQGCVGSRNNGDHLRVAHNGRDFPGIMDVDNAPDGNDINGNCGDEILPLTDNIDTVRNVIQNLDTGENTYIPSGLAWGWRMLDANEPYADASNLDNGRKRIMILMTDGANTLELQQPFHEGNGGNEGPANNVTQQLCTNIKADNVQVFTIAYRFGGHSTTARGIVQNCASNPSMFFDAQNAAQLETAFEQIGNALFSVRLTR